MATKTQAARFLDSIGVERGRSESRKALRVIAWRIIRNCDDQARGFGVSALISALAVAS